MCFLFSDKSIFQEHQKWNQRRDRRRRDDENMKNIREIILNEKTIENIYN